jgi:hypothetical protein
MNIDQLEALQWARCHHREMRRYLRILGSAKDVGASRDTIDGLRRWVRTLRGNASNSLITFRHAAN